MPRRPTISKSSFIRGKQCLKSLYLAKKHPELQDPVSESQQAVFDRGHSVGELACQLFPGGVIAAYPLPEGFMKSIFQTRTLIDQGYEILYEAGFMVNSTHCFADILVKDGDAWKVYEVKSSTRISETYLYDAAFQHRVITSAGLTISDFSIIFINNQYTRYGELDIRQLFTIESVHDRVLGLQDAVNQLLDRQVNVLLHKGAPPVNIGPHCFDPYDCDFMGHCWQDVPEYSVFNIGRLGLDKKFELYNNGIIHTDSVPDDFPLSANQRIQVVADRTGEPVIDRDSLRAFVRSLKYPLYFLDFETFNPAVPLYDRSRPYQQLVFQYSLHLHEKPGGPLKHLEFLAYPVSDPRLQVMDQLVEDLGTEGHIVVYNMGFESGRLQEMANDFPRYEMAIGRILDRMIDLMAPFQQKHLYTPDMKGSYSIKYVLPALLPEFSYTDLPINNGGDASLAFERLYSVTDPVERDTTRNNLLAYCRLDTLAMVEILGVIGKLAGGNGPSS